MTESDYLQAWRGIALRWRMPGQETAAKSLWQADGFWLAKVPAAALYDAIDELETEHKVGTYPRPVDLHQKLRRHSTPAPAKRSGPSDVAGPRSLDPRLNGTYTSTARPVILKRDGSGDVDEELTAEFRNRTHR